MLVACSGGPDSTALVLLVAQARPDVRPTLAYVAHGLRGAEVDGADAEQVAAVAALLGAEHVVLPVTVVRSGGGVEADARDVRHAALEAEADRRGVDAVLYGHHADDQAETLLLRLARGTGIEGLGGMSPIAGRRLRPLLDVRRDDLHRVADEVLARRIADAGGSGPGPARVDPMNADEDVARVRLRREVLPALGRVGPDPVGALARLAALARDESEVLERLVDELWQELPVITFGSAVLVPSGRLRDLPVALGRRLVRAALGGAPDAATVERMLAAPDGWRATLPGPLDVSIDRGWHIVVPAAPSDGTATATDEGSVQALVPDEQLVHAPSGMRIVLRSAPAEVAAGASATAEAPAEGRATLQLEATLAGGVPPGILPDRMTVRVRVEGPLFVRTRRDGDRLRTPGGTRSLGDILGEVGMPRALRDLLPVVVASDGHPVWAPGVVVDADYARASGVTRSVATRGRT